MQPMLKACHKKEKTIIIIIIKLVINNNNDDDDTLMGKHNYWETKRPKRSQPVFKINMTDFHYKFSML